MQSALEGLAFLVGFSPIRLSTHFQLLSALLCYLQSPSVKVIFSSWYTSRSSAMTVVCLSAATKPNRVAEGPHTASASRTIDLKPSPLSPPACAVCIFLDAVHDPVNLPYIEEPRHQEHQPVDLKRSTLILLSNISTHFSINLPR